jgi:hypothetical protein
MQDLFETKNNEVLSWLHAAIWRMRTYELDMACAAVVCGNIARISESHVSHMVSNGSKQVLAQPPQHVSHSQYSLCSMLKHVNIIQLWVM